MTLSEATVIFSDISNSKYSDEEKALAIYQVMNMPTQNSVTKNEMLEVIKFLWNQSYELESEQE